MSAILSRPHYGKSYPYNGNPYTGKMVFILKQDPESDCQVSYDD